MTPLLGHQGAHGIDGALAAAPSEHDLGDHDGDADGHGTQDVDQDKGPAAVLPGGVREAPDVAEPHSRAGRGQDEGQATGPHAMD